MSGGKWLDLPVYGFNELMTMTHQEIVDIHYFLLPLVEWKEVVKGLFNLLPGNALLPTPALHLLVLKVQQLVENLLAHAFDGLFNRGILIFQHASKGG